MVSQVALVSLCIVYGAPDTSPNSWVTLSLDISYFSYTEEGRSLIGVQRQLSYKCAELGTLLTLLMN